MLATVDEEAGRRRARGGRGAPLPSEYDLALAIRKREAKQRKASASRFLYSFDSIPTASFCFVVVVAFIVIMFSSNLPHHHFSVTISVL